MKEYYLTMGCIIVCLLLGTVYPVFGAFFLIFLIICSIGTNMFSSYEFKTDNTRESYHDVPTRESYHKVLATESYHNVIRKYYLPSLSQDVIKEIEKHISRDKNNKIHISNNETNYSNGCGTINGKIFFINSCENVDKAVEYSSLEGTKRFKWIEFSKNAFDMQEIASGDDGPNV